MLGLSKLLANIADVDVDDTIERAEFAAQNGLGQLFPGDNVASLAEKQFEQSEFNAGQIERILIQRGFPRLWIESNVAADERTCSRCCIRTTAKDGANACDEFARIEGFRHVVVCADLKAENSVNIFAACGEDEDRDWRFRANTTQYIESAHSGKHEVEDHKRVLKREGALKAANTLVYGFDGEAFSAEAFR